MLNFPHLGNKIVLIQFHDHPPVNDTTTLTDKARVPNTEGVKRRGAQQLPKYYTLYCIIIYIENSLFLATEIIYKLDNK